MTDMDELKKTIAATWRDAEMAASACYGVDAYSKLWCCVLMVNEWPLWNESGRGLRCDVVRWLDEQGSTWDFYHLLGEWGLVGFDDPQAAARFAGRWSGGGENGLPPDGTWNPHPLNSTFAPSIMDEASVRARKDRYAFR